MRPLFVLPLLLVLTACGGGEPVHPPHDAGPDAALPDASADAAAEAGPTGCAPRPDLGINDVEPGGSTTCVDGHVWECQLSGWVQTADDCDAGA